MSDRMFFLTIAAISVAGFLVECVLATRRGGWFTPGSYGDSREWWRSVWRDKLAVRIGAAFAAFGGVTAAVNADVWGVVSALFVGTLIAAAIARSRLHLARRRHGPA